MKSEALLHGFLQKLVFAVSLGQFDGVMDGEQKLVIGKRLGDIIESPVLHGLHSTFNGAESSHDQDGSIRPLLLYPFQHIKACNARHLHVRNDNVHLALLKESQRRLRVAQCGDGVPLILEQCLQDKQVVLFVIDNQDMGILLTHSSLPEASHRTDVPAGTPGGPSSFRDNHLTRKGKKFMFPKKNSSPSFREPVCCRLLREALPWLHSRLYCSCTPRPGAE